MQLAESYESFDLSHFEGQKVIPSLKFLDGIDSEQTTLGKLMNAESSA